MPWGDGRITSTQPPKRIQGGKKKIIRSSHRRGPSTVVAHTRRLANGRVVLVKPTRRSATQVSRHEKAGKGYGVREKRASGKVDYRRKERQSKKTPKKGVRNRS